MNIYNNDITYEQVRKYFDYIDGKLFWKISPHPKILIGTEAGWNALGYRNVQINGKSYRTHRLVWLWYYGEWPDHGIDHINRIRNDNRIENLRLATYEGLSDHGCQNHCSTRKDNKSGYPGIFWNKKLQKWQGYINIKGERIHLGVFKLLEDAIESREKARAKYWEFSH